MRVEIKKQNVYGETLTNTFWNVQDYKIFEMGTLGGTSVRIQFRDKRYRFVNKVYEIKTNLKPYYNE